MKKITDIICPAIALFTFACLAVSPQVRADCQHGCNTANMNTFLGDNALLNNIGINNTAIGSNALLNNTSGNGNTASGFQALLSNVTGFGNTANGAAALIFNTTGISNTASGSAALFSNTTGGLNTASGVEALFSNTTGAFNTASGVKALRSNTTGDVNTATGFQALFNNTTGIHNTANGANALYSNTTGMINTATGYAALFFNTTGHDNTADGVSALVNNSTGSFNIALGSEAGINLDTGDNNIDIGNEGLAGDSNTIRIGTQGTQTATFIAGIRGTPITGGMQIGVNSSGQLGVRPSSARFKEAIQPMDNASEAILALKPVTFRYKKELDPKGVPQFGLTAEEVAKVNPDLVVRDEQGKPFTVRYEEVNAMLLNEFLKEHRKVEQVKKDFESKFAEQQTQIQQLTAGLQKVSAQLELSKTAPRTVVNTQ